MLQQFQASQANLNNQEIFRIRQALESPGDIFEFDASMKAIFLGPEASPNELVVAYHDPTRNDRIQLGLITPERPFLGRIDALLARRIQASSSAGRIVVYPRALFDNSFIANTPVADAADLQTRLPVLMDLIGYTSEPASAPDRRSELLFRTPVTVPDRGGGNGAHYFYIPAYGRRHFYIEVLAHTALAGHTLTVNGHNFRRVAIPGTPGQNASTINLSSDSIGSTVPATVVKSFDAEVVGFFDLVSVVIDGPTISAADTTSNIEIEVLFRD